MKLKDLLEKYGEVELTEEFKKCLGIKESKRWKPECGNVYYFIDKYEDVDYIKWYDDDFDIRLYNLNNCYKTKKEAKFYAERHKIQAELEIFALENNDEKIDWSNDDVRKWFIYYDFDNKKIYIDHCCCYKQNNVYFSSIDLAEKAIKQIGEDRLIKYYFGDYLKEK